MPFGEDIFANVGARTTALNHGSNTDNLRQKFTGYQKDNETDLDFAEARMYENRFGRFTAVDPMLASGKSANPQTFNRFVYAGNNPIVTTDPTGMDWFKHFNKETKLWEYQDESKSPGEGWDPVDFGDKDYTTVSDWCWNRQCSGSTAYLYKAGKWDYGALAHYGLSDALWDTGVGSLKWGYNSLAGISNLGWGIAARATWEYIATGNPREVPYAGYYEYSNQMQSNAAITLTAGSFILPALTATRGASVARLALSDASETAAEVSVGSGRGYSVAFETRLSSSSYPGVSRARHFQEANRNLFNAMKADSQFNTLMNKLIPGVEREISPANGAFMRRSPTNWTWHHAEEPGVMQLVPRIQH